MKKKRKISEPEHVEVVILCYYRRIERYLRDTGGLNKHGLASIKFLEFPKYILNSINAPPVEALHAPQRRQVCLRMTCISSLALVRGNSTDAQQKVNMLSLIHI